MPDIEFRPYTGPMTITHYAVFSPNERRSWRERLFSWPWRPWQRYAWGLVAGGELPPDGA